jgi:hypothetical protein
VQSSPPHGTPRPATPVMSRILRRPRRWGRLLAASLALVLVAALVPAARAEESGAPAEPGIPETGLLPVRVEAEAYNVQASLEVWTPVSPDDAAAAGGGAGGDGGDRAGEQEQRSTQEPAAVAEARLGNTASQGAAPPEPPEPPVAAAAEGEQAQQQHAGSGDGDVEAPTELVLVVPPDRGGGQGQGRPPDDSRLPADAQSAPDASHQADPGTEQTGQSPAGGTELAMPNPLAPVPERIRAAAQAVRGGRDAAFSREYLEAWHRETLDLWHRVPGASPEGITVYNTYQRVRHQLRPLEAAAAAVSYEWPNVSARLDERIRAAGQAARGRGAGYSREFLEAWQRETLDLRHRVAGASHDSRTVFNTYQRVTARLDRMEQAAARAAGRTSVQQAPDQPAPGEADETDASGGEDDVTSVPPSKFSSVEAGQVAAGPPGYEAGRPPTGVPGYGGTQANVAGTPGFTPADQDPTIPGFTPTDEHPSVPGLIPPKLDTGPLLQQDAAQETSETWAAAADVAVQTGKAAPGLAAGVGGVGLLYALLMKTRVGQALLLALSPDVRKALPWMAPGPPPS